MDRVHIIEGCLIGYVSAEMLFKIASVGVRDVSYVKTFEEIIICFTRYLEYAPFREFLDLYKKIKRTCRLVFQDVASNFLLFVSFPFQVLSSSSNSRYSLIRSHVLCSFSALSSLLCLSLSSFLIDWLIYFALWS